MEDFAELLSITAGSSTLTSEVVTQRQVQKLKGRRKEVGEREEEEKGTGKGKDTAKAKTKVRQEELVMSVPFPSWMI